MDKNYNHKQAEEKIYKLWEDSGYFNPDNLPGERTEPYSIVLPPPNVTGTLHVGHAAMLAVEDILIRFERMRGKKTLWLPGTDSAAIATQSKVEDLLYKKEKKTRHDVGREELLKKIDAFTEESKNTIINQLRRLGSSLDWSRYAYTMDDARYNAVMEAFVRMYHAGLIYQGHRIVNWDPKLQTTVSDDEIEWKEETIPFYYLTYGPFTIATARPETKFGDKYVVMHPKDKRYSQYTHGQKLEVEWINGKITATVIKDEVVDMEFGTGVMTITPWHDATDFEIAERHELDKEQIIDERGLLLPIAGEFAGQHIKKARPLIVEKLKQKGLIAKIDEKYTHNIATNSRGGGIIEPQIKKQWFVAVNKEFVQNGQKTSLKALMRDAVNSHKVTITPERFEKVYFHWIDNLRDWCISRQIWFGHRIPVWYRPKDDQPLADKGNEMYVGTNPPEGEGWTQDPDTLDTWFSSGLWTFSTLGWPNQTTDLKTFHPTSVLETGYDILFFWVARMILMSGFLLGDVPFKKVYLHGLVRDGQGRKMSKSLGNIIDPLDMIEKYGADSLRLSLILGAAPGNDIKLSEDRVRGYKNFCNKLWNIGRFIDLQMETNKTAEIPFYENSEESLKQLDAEDNKIVQELNTLIKETTSHIEQFRLDFAADLLYQFAWHRFADEYIENFKLKIENLRTEGKTKEIQKTISVLRHVFLNLLKLLHPFMPYVTEEIWSVMPKKKNELLMISSWPKID